MKKKNFKLRFEELPAFGELVETSFLLDKELFAAFSPVYANGFSENYRGKLQAVKDIISPRLLTEKRKIVTENLHAAHVSLLALTDNIKRYCEMAGDKRNFTMEALQLKALRKNIRSHNSEAVVRGAREMQQVLKTNVAVLEEYGYNSERQAELDKLITTIDSLNIEQVSLLNERRRLVENNTSQLNEFWDMVQDLMKTGQIIHRNNPLRKTEYTDKTLRSRVRLIAAPKQVEVPEAQKEVPPDQEHPVAA